MGFALFLKNTITAKTISPKPAPATAKAMISGTPILYAPIISPSAISALTIAPEVSFPAVGISSAFINLA